MSDFCRNYNNSGSFVFIISLIYLTVTWYISFELLRVVLFSDLRKHVSSYFVVGFIMVSEPTINITVGTRIDVAGDKGMVKYVGKVANTEGEWLGVDWDDPKRGKHDGTYMDVQYFKARYKKLL